MASVPCHDLAVLCPMSHHYSGDPITLDLAAACALLLGAHMTNRHSMHNLQRSTHTFATSFSSINWLNQALFRGVI